MRHYGCARMQKRRHFWQRRLNHSGMGGGIALREVYPARAYTTVVVLVDFAGDAVLQAVSECPLRR